METIIRRGELCEHDLVCVKYMTNTCAFSRDKTLPIEIKNDEDVQIYLNDINGEGGRPILRVFLIEKSLESGCGLNNQQFENENICTHNDDFHGGGETNIFIKTNENIIEDVLRCQVEKEVPRNNEEDNVLLPEQSDDAMIGTHHSYIFSDGSGFHKGYKFLNKEVVVNKLKLVAIRKGFEFATKKSKNHWQIMYLANKSSICQLYAQDVSGGEILNFSAIVREKI
ncbi:hypothetical protein RND71_023411 [Anisodus tanguticus]|uniref:Uncharacterized protein n=1 Tax=Anisodus tanguticus TaxID=243964 RepID=A0AAE1RVJ5_9SOLA|nr:hypothetical protein RND71_023411 [Anisodus tanguticus]